MQLLLKPDWPWWQTCKDTIGVAPITIRPVQYLISWVPAVTLSLLRWSFTLDWSFIGKATVCIHTSEIRSKPFNFFMTFKGCGFVVDTIAMLIECDRYSCNFKCTTCICLKQDTTILKGLDLVLPFKWLHNHLYHKLVYSLSAPVYANRCGHSWQRLTDELLADYSVLIVKELVSAWNANLNPHPFLQDISRCHWEMPRKIGKVLFFCNIFSSYSNGG